MEREIPVIDRKVVEDYEELCIQVASRPPRPLPGSTTDPKIHRKVGRLLAKLPYTKPRVDYQDEPFSEKRLVRKTAARLGAFMRAHNIQGKVEGIERYKDHKCPQYVGALYRRKYDYMPDLSDWFQGKVVLFGRGTHRQKFIVLTEKQP